MPVGKVSKATARLHQMVRKHLRREAHPAVARAVQIRIEPPNMDEAPLAAVGLQRMPGMRCKASAVLKSGNLMISLKGCTSMRFGACCFSAMASARLFVAFGTNY